MTVPFDMRTAERFAVNRAFNPELLRVAAAVGRTLHHGATPSCIVIRAERSDGADTHALFAVVQRVGEYVEAEAAYRHGEERLLAELATELQALRGRLN